MNRERWIVSVFTVLALWLLGALILLPGVERALEQATREVLEAQPLLANRIGRVSIAFDGQVARLRGEVRSAQDRAIIEATVRDLVRAPAPFAAGISRRLNPVAWVRNEIELAPYPPGWLLLAAGGTHARLLGAAASEFEARDLALSVQESWQARGGSLQGQPEIDASQHDEAMEVSATVRGVPAPQAFAQMHLAKIGGAWRTLSLDKPDAVLKAEARATGISEADWQERILPLLVAMRATLAKQQAAEAEARRLAALPPGHVFLATRGEEVVMRGEVGSTAIKNSLLHEALEVFAPRQVRDEIRVSAARRPSEEFGPVTTALLPPDEGDRGKALFLGFGGEAWMAVDWEVGSVARPWHKYVPRGVKLEWLLGDSTRIIDWLKGTNAPAPPVAPAFVMLAIFGGKVILSGRVAEESTRSQFIAAVRRASAQRWIVIHDGLRLNAACRPWAGVLDAVKGLPPFPARGAAFHLVNANGSWIDLPVTPDLLQPGGIARSGLLPPDLPPALVESHAAEAVEQLRAWMAASPAPTTP